MEELALRLTGVATWLFTAFMGYGLYVHDCKKRGKACLLVSLVALSIMSLQPWGSEQAIFDSVAPEHGHGSKSKIEPVVSYPLPSKTLETFEPTAHKVDLADGTKLGEVYWKSTPPKSKPVVSSFH